MAAAWLGFKFCFAATSPVPYVQDCHHLAVNSKQNLIHMRSAPLEELPHFERELR